MTTAIELIQSGENEQLQKLLEKEPILAEGKTETGISLLQLAAYCRNTGAIEILRSFRSTLDLFEAAALGETEYVLEILEMDEEMIDEHSIDGFTALGLASFFGHLELAEMLLRIGADPNIASNNSFKVTPLHSACATSDLKMAELLIQSGADVNAKQMNGVSPLHSAAHNGQTELAKLLVENGANIHALMDNGKSPLDMAMEGEFEEVANYLNDIG